MRTKMKKKKAEQEIEDQAKALEELTLDWRKAKALYRQTEQALKEAKDRSWCTIS
jgi:exonuclease VII small subunit